jgi:methionyl-tRNA formyltransferase
MTFAFFGTPYVARDTLAVLIAHGLTPSIVVTNPDAKRGRAQLLTPSETKTVALEHEIPVLTPETLDAQAIDAITAFKCDAAIVVAYGKILPQALIEAFPKGVYNVHYSLLPKYRGAAPVEAALRNDDTETGVTLQRMAVKLDAGDIVASEFETILPTDTTRSLRERLIERGAAMLVAQFPMLEAGTIIFTPQDESRASYAPKLTKNDGLLDLAAPPRENWNKYRAYQDWPGTFFFVEQNGVRVRVKINDAILTPEGAFHIRRVTPEGKREMDYDTFCRSIS